MAPHQREPQEVDILDTDTHILTHTHWGDAPSRDADAAGPTMALMV